MHKRRGEWSYQPRQAQVAEPQTDQVRATTSGGGGAAGTSRPTFVWASLRFSSLSVMPLVTGDALNGAATEQAKVTRMERDGKSIFPYDKRV